MSRLIKPGLIVVCLALTGMIVTMAADKPIPDLRAEAEKLIQDGQYKEAYTLFEQLAKNEKNSGQNLVDDIQKSVQCLNQLQRHAELDDLLEQILEAHPEDWRAFWSVAEQKMQNVHYGFVVAGEFKRGQQRGGGQYSDASARDRVQALRWLAKANELKPEGAPGPLTANFYKFYASAVRDGRHGTQAWLLQDLTDLETLPDFVTGYGYRQGSQRTQGAPVDENGDPVYYDIPESFESARNDGERWRWLLAEVAQANPSRENEIQMEFAQFAHQQFGVRTLQQWGIRLPTAESEEEKETGTWELSTLENNETISQLATGVKRFTLRDDYNFISLFKGLAASESRSYSEPAFQQLAQIYEDRQQYPEAALVWAESIRKHGDSRNQYKQKRLDQIVKNWGEFEPITTQPAGKGATIDYRFRNGDQVSFKAYELNVPLLLDDVKAYLKSSPQRIDWQKTQLGNIGYRIVQQNESKYLGKQVADWRLELEPRPNHYDRRVTVTTPLQKAGAYLLVAQMKDGNLSRIIVWLDDTAIVKKNLNGKSMYFVADAVTGEPISKMKVDFFGWKQERVENTKRQFRLVTQQLAEFTDKEGMIETDAKLMNRDYQWLATAKDDRGRLAYLGFSNVWYNQFSVQSYQQRKAYVVTDRPVYRPDQKVEFKFWMREAKYDQTDSSLFANKEFTVHIQDPQGTEVFKLKKKTDEYGGLAGEFTLPEDAKLGQYYLYIDHNHGISGGNHFRVEEYKKPEFEVTIETPDKPAELGETIKATIQAKYYYGAPVSDAKVTFKVERSQHDSRWFPVTRWDWLYGNGYWWYTSDYDWYPGFSRWGCLSPRPFWQNWNPNPPELVLDQEVEIGPDGTVEFEIDTSLAKALHGDHDHEYQITAEVTDASRRTIVGSGKILVAREPFKVFTWTNRGHYRIGDTITANFQARTIAGSGVQGTGKLKLLKITYEGDQPKETVVEEWDLDTNADGQAEQKIKANSVGQYRLSYSVTSDNRTIEGGYLFVIRGVGFDGSDYRFDDLELITNQKTYKPGDDVELLINTNRIGSTVLLFLRPSNGVYAGRPQVHRIEGKSKTVKIGVVQKDMPNFFVEAITISNGDLHTAVQQIAVPPEDRVINVEIVSDEERYLPGADAKVKVKLTDETGEPFVGSVVMSVYDRAVEYISGGSNVPEIREFFWNWKRNHRPNTEHSLQRYFGLLMKQGEIHMTNLGAFGDEIANRDNKNLDAINEPQALSMSPRSMMRKGGAPMPAAAPAMEMSSGDAAGFGGGGGGGIGSFGAKAQTEMVQPTVRENFADTAFWKADLTTNKNGIADVSFEMPENLSAWKIRAWGMGHGTNVGEGTSEVVTAKNLVVRLQAPRFFVEKDEVVLSAVVHNYLENEKSVQVAINLEGETLALMSETDRQRTVTIPAGGEARIDWRVKAIAEGTATVTMQALTDEESDAMKMEFPVFVHGFLKTESFSGVIRPKEKSGKLIFSVPEDRRPQESRLEIRYSPTLAGAMVDALPYLVEYPYGCTEQTLNRFVPTVITQGILQRMNLDLAAIQEKRTNLNAQEIGDDKERATQWKRFKRNPVFDEAEVSRMVKKGVQDLTAMQNSDGGWGWFSGYGERSYPHTTAVVVHGLQQAQKNDIAIVDGIVEQGIAWLQRYQAQQVELLQEGLRHADDPKRKKPYKTQANNIDALVFSVLVESKVANEEMQRFLYRDRLKLSLYAQSQLGLALDTLGEDEQRDMIVRNIDQFITVDDENQTAYIDMPNNTYWWYWYGSNIEANAHYLKLLARINPEDPKAAGLVKYILNNRKHGTYWTNTRDTAYCVEALAAYLEATDELSPELTVEVWVDGEQKQTVEITKENLFSFDNSFILEGEALTSGEHTVELRKSGKGPLYHNAYLTYFSLEDFITKAGLEIKVQRKFYKLVQNKEATATVAGSRGQVVDQKKLKYDRVELENLDEVTSGDLIEVELEIDSKNDYEYVIFEDLKAAGAEAVDLQSGYTKDGLGAYVEFRDERVAFFMRTLSRGKHSVSYRLRAEIPGQFSALPARAYAMYAPELKANSDEMKIKIADAE